MRICYHGTSEENAKSILREGFRDGTWFAANLQDALAFGGSHVFQVAFDFDEAPGWQFHTDAVPPERIVACTVYEQREVFRNEELRRKVFEANTSPKPERSRL